MTAPEKRTGPLRGGISAAVTPLSADGDGLDLEAVGPLVDFYAGGGLTGAMLGGTTGEGVLLTVDERKRLTEAFVEAAAGRIHIVVHAGAQSTADTVAIADHASAAGATAISVIAPPYFRLDDAALLQHLVRAATACTPTPFYIYEFIDRSGYPVPPDVMEALAERCENFVGLKVSDAPMERFETYLLPWLDILVGPEPLITEGFARGAVGAVSALASAFPEIVAAAVANPTNASTQTVTALRRQMERQPLHAALKCMLNLRGIPINESVRSPLRGLTPEERASLQTALSELELGSEFQASR